MGVRTALLLLAASAAGVSSKGSAAAWQEETEARGALQAQSVRQALRRAAGNRRRAQHRPRGGSEAPWKDDAIQRMAKDLLRTVRPATEWKPGEPIGLFIDTYYFNVVEADYPGPQTIPLKDGKGNLLALVTAGFWEHFSVEGTGRLLDGRQLNTSEEGTVVVDAPMGEGTCRLVAWRTMAVDPRIIPLGTVVRIDETVGLKLPDGSLCDGYWRAEDTGGEVRNAHVDLYIGDGGQAGAALEDAGIHLEALTVRYVGKPPASCATP